MPAATAAATAAPELCVESCKFSRKEGGKDMLRCCLCLVWFHLLCLGVPKAESTGFWTCPTCRTMPALIASLHSMVSHLTATVDAMSRRLTGLENTNKELTAAASKKTDECDKLLSENSTLRRENGQLTTDKSKTTWTNFRKDRKRNTLLMGSSLIRDIDESRLRDTRVVSISGAKTYDLTEELNHMPDSETYDRVVIVGGGNDCAQRGTSLDTIIERFSRLIQTAKTKAASVFVSSVCPRRPRDTQDKIELLNSGLQGLCDDIGCEFVDSTPLFTLADGNINDGYLTGDGVHLTRKGQNRLAERLKLTTRATDGERSNTDSYDVCFHPTRKTDPGRHDRKGGDRSATTETSVTSRERPRDTRTTDPKPTPSLRRNDRYSRTDEEEWTTVGSRRRPGSSSRSRLGQQTDLTGRHQRGCRFCGEDGHSTDRCRHGQEVECHSCHRFGHKAKFCNF